MKWIKSLFGGRDRAKKRSAKAAGDLRFEPGGLKPMGEIPRYPPFTKGLPAAAPKDLLDTQETLIRQLKHELALTPEQNKALVDPLLLAYASFVHLLPASKGHHHRGAGGMLRHGLEVALWSTRGFHTRIIDGHESGERRKVLEPRWRLAVAVAGLCHDLGKAAYDVTVTDPSGKKIWDVYESVLSDWIKVNKLDRYFISWRSAREHKAHERFGHLLTMRVIPPQVLSFLNEGSPRIISVMYETIAGEIPKGPAKVVYELVTQADQNSVSRDIQGQRVAESDSALGVPVAKYLVDAMKRLVDNGQWKANEEGQPLWVTGEGVFLDWEKAVPDITGLLVKDGVSGIPRSQSSVAESLSDFDVIKMQHTPDGEETFFVAVAPEKLSSKKKVHKFKAVQLTAISTLFEGPHPAPVELHVGLGAIEAREAINEKREKKLAEERNDRALKRHEEKITQTDGQSRPVMQEPGVESRQDAKPQIPEPEAADMEHLAQSQPHLDSKADQEEVPAEAQSEPEPSKTWIETLSGEQKEVIERCFIPGKCKHAHVKGGEVVVKYPEGLAVFGEERNAKLDAIKPLLAEHPTVPEKPTQKRAIGGKEVNALVIAGEAAEALISMTPEVAEPAPTQDKEPETATKGQKTPPKRTKSADKGKAQGKSKAKPKAQMPPEPSPTEPKAEKDRSASTQQEATDSKEAAEPEVATEKPKKEQEPKRQPRKARASKPAAKSKPKPQQPPKTTAAMSPMLPEIKSRVLEAYPNEKISDSDAGGIWVSVPDSAAWYVENVRPDLNLGPVMAALYQLQDDTDRKPPNNHRDFVLVK